MMGTPDVRVDTNLNKHVWSKGIRYVCTGCCLMYCALLLQMVLQAFFGLSIVATASATCGFCMLNPMPCCIYCNAIWQGDFVEGAMGNALFACG